MNLRRRWAHLKAAFSRQASASTALGEMGLLGPAGVGVSVLAANSPAKVFKAPPPETWLVERCNPLVNTPIANSAGFQVGQAWARSIIAADLPPDRGLIR